MKKRLVWVCLLLVCVTVLASCDLFRPAPKSAEELWERIDEQMEQYDAYAMSMEMDMSMEVEGYAIKLVSSGSIIEDKAEDYYYYSETNMSMICDELDMNQKMQQISAYWDGKAFEISDSDGVARKLYSEMTAEQYEEYSQDDEDDEDDEDFDFSDCTDASFAQNEDKSWTLTYSGYTKKAMDRINEQFGMQEADMFGAEFLDMEVVISADKDFLITDISIVFEFDAQEGSKTAPVLNIRMKLTEVGNVTRQTDKLDVSKCTQVDDLGVLKQIDDQFEEIANKEQGKIHYEINQTFKVMGQTESGSEIYDVEYGTKDGKLHYELSTDVEGYTTKISYENGKQTVSVSGESYTEDYSEEEAKTFIKDLINDSAMGYSADNVSNIKSLGNGVWEITQTVSSEYFEELMTTMGADYKSATQTIKVTIKDGVLTNMTNQIAIKGSYSESFSTFEISFDITIKTDFS